MNLTLWIVAGVLAAALLASTSKAFIARERIAASGGEAARWIMDFSPGFLRALAALEFLAALGLILPAALDIAPILVPVTAACVALLFTGAAIMRARRGERKTLAPDLVYLALALFLAIGRFAIEPFTG
ncbi:DoxX family protein [Glycomyces endophyticus]|uniref:DoxX family protein n=1 Tax=Glycomyces endophyticus TaxID=480996 RepID=A0ABN2GHE4_9ACTN